MEGIMNKIVARMIICVFVLVLLPWAYGQELSIHHFDVGHGDCILVIGPNGKGLLIDAGTLKYGSKNDPKRIKEEIGKLLAVTPYNPNNPSYKPYYMLASHYHGDHINWLDDVIEHIGQPVIAFDRGGSHTGSSYANAVEGIIPNTGVNVRQTIELGDMEPQGLDLGPGVKATCVAMNTAVIGEVPGSGSTSNENANSIGVVISYGGFDYLTCGDLTKAVEPKLGTALVNPDNGIQDIDIYKINHHGSGGSTDVNFINDIKPEVSVCPCGPHAGFNLPKLKTYQTLHSVKSYIYQLSEGVDSTYSSGEIKSVKEPPPGWGLLVDDPVTITTNGYIYSATIDTLNTWTDNYIVDENYIAGLWDLDEGSGATAADGSGNENDGTLQNGPSPVTGISGKALEFYGTDQSVEVFHSSTLDITDAITLQAWVKPDSTSGERMIIGKDDAYFLWLQNGILRFEINDGNSNPYVSGPLNGTDWHHVAGTYDGEDLKLYLDGMQVDSYLVETTINSNSSNVFFGNSEDGNQGFDGIIDEVRIDSRALSEEEIGNRAQLREGVWHFDEGSGVYTYDSSGNVHRGFYADPTWDVDYSPWISNGIVKNALQFDGDAHLYVPDHDTLDGYGSNYSIEAWIRRDDTTGQKRTILHKGNAGGPLYALALDENDKLAFLGNNGDEDPDLVSTNPVPADLRKHVAVTVSPGVSKL
jgi:beta-lactamase superfamily II metal-dependent hydrolase